MASLSAMAWPLKSGLIVFVAALAFAQNPAPGGDANITGTVIDAVSRQPLKNAVVTLIIPPDSSGAAQSVSPVRTDGTGAFLFPNIRPGHYRLTVSRENYPQSRFNPAKSVEVQTSGKEPVTVGLVPPAAVSGRIFDEDGDPLAGCSVDLHPAESPTDSVYVQRVSNASGYRLFGIPPGKYILEARCGSSPFEPRPFSAGPDPPSSSAYPPRFYADGLNASSAQNLELPAGTETTGIDFHMKPAPVTQVHLTLSSPDHLDAALIAMSGPSRPMAGEVVKDGNYEFPKVFPGQYLLVVSNGEFGRDRIGAARVINVARQPVNAGLTPKQAIDIKGSVELEDRNGTPIHLSEIRLRLVADYPGLRDGDGFFPRSEAQVKEDGSFVIESVIPGYWRLIVSGPAFVRSVLVAGREVNDNLLDLSSGAPLRIRLSANTATIRGSAPPGLTVGAYKIDDSHPSIAPQFVSTDGAGQFQLAGLAPGRYRVAAGETRIAIPDDAGVEVAVGEGETATVDLKTERVRQ